MMHIELHLHTKVRYKLERMYYQFVFYTLKFDLLISFLWDVTVMKSIEGSNYFSYQMGWLLAHSH